MILESAIADLMAGRDVREVVDRLITEAAKKPKKLSDDPIEVKDTNSAKATKTVGKPPTATAAVPAAGK